MIRIELRAALLLLALVLAACDNSSGKVYFIPDQPRVPTAQVTGPITNGTRGFPATPAAVDLAAAGYVEEEFFLQGTARAYDRDGDWSIDGRWPVVEASSADYTTRILVRRPADASAFSGVVVVEWFNVTSAIDLDVDFSFLSGEILREGHAWVGVTAQGASVTSTGGGSLGPDALGLMAWDSARYQSLDHPGDAYAYDIFSQVGATPRDPGAVDPLAGLAPTTLIGNGESQASFYMLSYVNAFHRLARVYDGFLIHSRWGAGAPIDGPITADTVPDPAPARVRDDLSAPVLQVVTETDLFSLAPPGYPVDMSFPGARQPDSDSVRTWELAGTAHADAHSLDYLNRQGQYQFDSFFDLSIILPLVNSAPQHLAMNAALNALVNWVREGVAPASGEPISTADGAILRDARGNALGGIRLPHIDVPVALISGEGGIPRSGRTVAFDTATLEALYPSASAYVDAVTESAQRAVDAGFLLPADAQVIIAEAESNPPVP